MTTSLMSTTHREGASSQRGHVLLVGKTGMGKSRHLRQMSKDVIATGHGLLLIDPHGDLADDVLALVPRRRKNDLVVFDARHPERSPGLNPLRNVTADVRSPAVSAILATMKKIWPDAWGMRTEHLSRHALLALMEIRGATLVDVRDILRDERHRAWVVKQLKNDEVRLFWAKEFPQYGKRLQAEATAAPLNKLGAFLASDSIREILTKRRPILDASVCMAKGRIVIARLSKGAVGEDGAYLLGGLLLGAFQRATMARESLPLEARRPFSIYVDEVGSFATKPFLELMAEARKYGVTLALATQSLAAMDPPTRAGLLANVGTLVAFRVGAEDALILQKEFSERFGPPTLMRLDVGERVVKLGGREAQIIAPD